MDATQRPGFLEGRRHSVNSSDMARLCDLSNWGYALDVYVEKVKPRPDKQTEPQAWGILLEEAIAARYASETGFVVRKPDVVTRKHPVRTWMGASIDREAYPPGHPEDPHILEIKNFHLFKEDLGPSGTDQIPQECLIQCQWQLAVSELEWAVLAVLVGGQELRTYPVRRNPGMIRDLIAIGAAFWQCVQEKKPPQPDWSWEHTADLVLWLTPPRKGLVVDLADDWLPLVHEYEAVKERHSTDEKTLRRLRGQLLCAMDGASEARVSGHTLKASTRHTPAHHRQASDSVSLTVKKAKETVCHE